MIRNIVICSDYAYVEGGATQVAINNAISLAERGFNVYFVSGMGDPCEEITNSKVKPVPLHVYDLLNNPSKMNAFINGIYNIRVKKKLSNFLESLPSAETVIHVHTYTKALTSACFDVAREKKIKVYITVHDYFLACPNGGFYNYKKKSICYKKPLSLSCMICDCDSRKYYYKLWRLIRQRRQNKAISQNDNIHLIYLSKFSKRILEDNLAFSKESSMLRNPVTIVDRRRVRAENNSHYYYIGRICSEKGTDLFCEATKIANVAATVIGEGDCKEDLQRNYPNVEFVGWKSKAEIRKLLNDARVLVFPSPIFEVSPLTVPEVQAYGIPCIVTECSAASGYINEGKNGHIVKATAESIADGIRTTYDDKHVAYLSRNTYDSFSEEYYSNENVIDDLIKIYNSNETGDYQI